MESYLEARIDSSHPVLLLQFYTIHGVLALFINILGAFLIWHNDKIVKFYKYFLFHMQIVSIIADTQMSLLMQPILLCPLPALYSNGPLWNWFGISSHLQMGIFLGLLYLQIAAIVSAIVAKHQVIVSIGTVEIHPFLFWIFIIGYQLISILIFAFFYLSDLSMEQMEQLIRAKFPNALNIFDIPNYAIYDMNMNSWFVWVGVCIITVIFLSITISAYFSMDLVRVLHSKRNLISAKNYRCHQVAVTSLMAQACLPMIVVVIPMLIINYYFVKVTPNSQGISNALMALYSIHSSLSTLVMIISTPHYRKAMVLKIKEYGPWKHSSTSVHVFPPPPPAHHDSNSTGSKSKAEVQSQGKTPNLFSKF